LVQALNTPKTGNTLQTAVTNNVYHDCLVMSLHYMHI